MAWSCWGRIRCIAGIRLAVLAVELCVYHVFTPYMSSHRLERHSPLIVWDSLWFADIAAKGYDFEQKNAFYPGVPLLLRVLGSFLSSVAAEIAAVALANASAITAIVMLVPVVEAHYPTLAKPWTVLVSLSQCSAFLSTAYTEPFFLLANAACLRLLLPPSQTLTTGIPWRAVLMLPPLAAAGSLRSNGAVLAGYLWFVPFISTVRVMGQGTRAMCRVIPRVALLSALAICGTVLALVPTAAMALRAQAALCPGRPWCGTVTGLYSFVQGEYWGVGFLQSLRPDQAGNILLAAPSLAIAGLAVVDPLNRQLRHAPADHRVQLGLLLAVQTAVLLTAATVMHINVFARLLLTTQPLVLLPALRRARVGSWVWSGVLGLIVGFGALGTVFVPLHLPFT
ncbi:GPI mannosyltransferase 2 [Carpediemonas membranifera]|uniref:GPI mannosyltransferase 2 n=1 Tax=Carpediemonas membranifera TaxID=201153 RepID=A0A8J6B2I9_9EUKA|nr:GPI mannosyltransferase 2 [Carpediemonas membranifera]|eukprot:KAG9392854.1 GPI mannosyltransferase 2 [Carpediemonas membranifera]